MSVSLTQNVCYAVSSGSLLHIMHGLYISGFSVQSTQSSSAVLSLHTVDYNGINYSDCNIHYEYTNVTLRLTKEQSSWWISDKGTKTHRSW
jgi:hypothetical protein